MKRYTYKNQTYNSIYDLAEAMAQDAIFIPYSSNDEQLRELGVTVELVKPSLDDARHTKKARLKCERDIREATPIDYKGKAFDYDDKARERMRIARQALEDNNLPSQTWTCADNTITELTVADFKAINTLAAQRSGQLHVQYNKLKVHIDGLNTIEEVQAVTFDKVV